MTFLQARQLTAHAPHGTLLARYVANPEDLSQACTIARAARLRRLAVCIETTLSERALMGIIEHGARWFMFAPKDLTANVLGVKRGTHYGSFEPYRYRPHDHAKDEIFRIHRVLAGVDKQVTVVYRGGSYV